MERYSLKPHGFLGWVLPPVLVCFLVLASCTSPWTAPSPPSVSGASYAVLGGYLYRIGGQNADGSWSPQTWCLAVPSSTQEIWTRGPDLPTGRAWAAVATADDYLYVAGGENASGQLSDVYTGYVDPSGQGIPGFLNAAGQPEWSRAPYNLPYPLSRAASVVAHGRWFLLGGQGTGGVPTANALSAAVLMDGSLGGWHLHSNFLSVPTWGATGFAWNSFLLSAGGETPSGYAPTQVWNWTGRQSLSLFPSTNSLRPLFYDAGSSVAWGSGLVGRTLATSWWAMDNLGGGQTPSVLLPPGQQILGRFSQALLSVDAQEGLHTWPWSATTCPAPLIFPVSGQITSPESPRIDPLPGCQVHYTWTPLGQPSQPPNASSPVWDPLHPLVLTASGRLAAIQTLLNGTKASVETDADYTALSLGFTLVINQNLTSDANYLPETVASDSLGTPGLNTWFQITLYSPALCHLGIQDATTGNWTAKISWSLVEQDEVTPVLNSLGQPLSQEPPGDYPGLQLSPGRYLLHVQSTDGQAGKSFGLLWEEVM